MFLECSLNVSQAMERQARTVKEAEAAVAAMAEQLNVH
jgi:hypothetical protein